MTSQINPNNIDNEYPVAGQDNSTQGFRDNFTFIKGNFDLARQEITELQNKVMLTQALGNVSAPAQNILNGSLLNGGSIQKMSAVVFEFDTPLTGTQNIDYNLGHYQVLDIDGSLTLNFIGFVDAIAGIDQQCWLILKISAEAGETLTLPTVSAGSLSGIQGLNVSNQTITFAETGTYEFEFRRVSNTIYITDLTRPKNRWTNPLFLASTEQVANAAAISLNTATSFFSTGATDQTANLAAGTAGQIKTLAVAVKGTGNVTVTVTNPGWSTSGTGTATFTELGHACTLQYFNSKWFCIGNNGVAFA